MPTVLQHRRGTATQNDAFTGAAGELTIDLTNDTIRVHDGTTAGGKRLATKAEADAALNAAAGLDSAKAIALIDSSYVTARIPATPTLGGSFVDSAEARKTISVTDAGGDGSLSYNNSTGVLTYTGPSAAEVRAHISAGEGIDISSGEISGEDATTTNKGIASFSTSNFTVSSGAVSLKTDGINDTHIDFGTGTNQVSTADIPEQTNLYFTNARAQSAAVADAINNGTTDVAPSQNAVFDALALKLDATSVPTLGGSFIDSAEAIKLIPTLGADFVDSGQVTTLIDSSYIQARQTASGVDSAATIALVDSAYVQARQSGGEITIQEEGSSLSTAATTLNFVGSGVTASGTGTTKTITISGGGSGTVDSAAVIALMDSASRHTFGLISVTNDASNGQSGQAQVQADTTRDLVKFVGGPGVAINTNASQDEITFFTVNQFDSAEALKLIPTLGADFVDSAEVNTLIDARDTHDSAAVQGQIDSAVNATFINNLTIDADTLGGQNSAYHLDYNNFTNTPTIPTLGGSFVDSAFVTTQINSLVDAAPGALNTLNELAAAIGDDANFSTTITNSIAAKLDSAQTIALIDSAYVLARAPAQDFLDSAEAIALIDSSYVQARQSATGGTDPIFKTIAVSGQSNIVADTTTDTLTVVGSTGITVTTNAGTDTLTFATTDGDIVHDNLSGFVANEHIDHTSVSIATGDGLSGGGTIASTRTLKIDSSDLASLYSKVIAHDNTNGFVANEHIDHTSVSIATGTGLSGGGTIASTRTLKIDSSDLAGLYSKVITHDNTSGFVANEHIDHTSVSIATGTGLSGGGTIASTRTLKIDSSDLAGLYSKVIAHDNTSGFVANEHIDHSTVSIIAGKGLSGGGTIASSRTIDIDSANVRGMFSGGTGITYNSGTGAISTTDGDIVHDNLSGFVANEHIDHTSVSIATGTGLSGGGTIASTRTLKIDSSDLAGLYSKVIAHDNTNGFVADEHIDHTSVSIATGTGLSGGGTIASTRTLKIDSSDLAGLYSKVIAHDNTSGFVANEHIDHSTVSIIAGKGLLGGGTIASSRTLNIDSANIDKIVDSNLADSSVIIDGNGSTGGITLSDGNIDIRTGTGSVSKIKFYCETNNAHAQTLQAQPHSASSSAVIVLPVASGTLLNEDGSGASLTSLNASELSSGTVPSARLSLGASDIPNLATSKITSGTFDSARIPGLAASDIVTGTIDSDRLPTGTFGGGGGGSSLTIQEEGSSLSTAATTLNFVGSAVTASGTGSTKTITITGGGGGLDSALTTQLIDSSYISDRALGGLGQNEFIYTATNNQTTFSGGDKKGNTLSYTADRIFVHLNGVLLNDSDDYTATNGTSVVLTTGATTNDELRVTAFGTATPPVTTGKAIAMAIVFGG